MYGHETYLAVVKGDHEHAGPLSGVVMTERGSRLLINFPKRAQHRGPGKLLMDGLGG
jgi:hypothetical protein